MGDIMKEKKNIPEIRFKGFEGKWGEVQLKDISFKITEKNSQVKYTETFTNSAVYGIISQRDYFDNDISNSENIDRYFVVKSDDFVYNPRISSFAPVGPINRNRLGRTGIMSPLYTVLRTQNVDKTYLEQFFKTDRWHAFMRLNGDTGARSDRFSIKDFLFFEMPIPFPEVEEQSQIGTFFQNLDKQITLEQQKHEKLISLKKAMLEKMFPKEGASVPEIRFEGFEREWEEVRLGDLGTFKSNGVDKTSNINEIPVYLLNYMDVYNRRKINVQNYHKLMSVTANASQVVDNNVLKNDVFFTPSSETPEDIGKVMVIEESLPNTVYSYHLVRFRPKENIFANIFPNYGLSSGFVRNQIILAAQGVQRFVINRSSFEELRVMLPSIKEQSQIGSYFQNLDNLISLQQQKIDKLKNIKKACLDKMFV